MELSYFDKRNGVASDKLGNNSLQLRHDGLHIRQTGSQGGVVEYMHLACFQLTTEDDRSIILKLRVLDIGAGIVFCGTVSGEVAKEAAEWVDDMNKRIGYTH